MPVLKCSLTPDLAALPSCLAEKASASGGIFAFVIQYDSINAFFGTTRSPMEKIDRHQLGPVLLCFKCSWRRQSCLQPTFRLLSRPGANLLLTRRAPAKSRRQPGLAAP